MNALLAALAALPVAAVAADSTLPPAQQELFETERAFVRLAAERGFRDSFYAYFADDGIAFNPHPFRVRAALASQPSTPAVSDWIQRSFSAFGSMPGLARKARSASQRAQCSAGGSFAPFTAITCTSPARPASEMASR